MSAQVAIYISAFMGMTALMALFGCLIYRRHRQMVDQRRAYERMAQERIQQAQESNLPPFYIDHVRDRACVFEGELPPDNYPRALEVVVVRPRREGSVEDLIPAGTTATGSTVTETDGRSFDNAGHPHSHHGRSPSSTMGLPDLLVSEMPQLGTPVVESGVIRPSPAGSFSRRPMRAVTSNNNPSPLAAAVLLPPIPTLAVTVHDDNNNNNSNDTDGQESIHTLPPPPSYDVTHIHTTPDQDVIIRPVSAPPAPGDYFNHHNIHHANSLHHHSSNNYHTQQQPYLQSSSQTSTPSLTVIHQPAAVATPSPSSSPFETPRYSDEFPSHIPHEQHLEGYRRARALSDVSLQLPQQEFSSLSVIVDPATAAPASVAEISSS